MKQVFFIMRRGCLPNFYFMRLALCIAIKVPLKIPNCYFPIFFGGIPLSCPKLLKGTFCGGSFEQCSENFQSTFNFGNSEIQIYLKLCRFVGDPNFCPLLFGSSE